MHLTLSNDEQPQPIVRSASYTVAELHGIFPLLPGVEADHDFGNIIAEAREEEVERILAKMSRDRDLH
jgi:hypothetical protein